MAAIISFFVGLFTGAAVYHYLYAERYRRQEINCDEKEKDRELGRQLERLMAYSGKEV